MPKLFGNTKCGCAYCKKWDRKNIESSTAPVLSRKEKKILGIKELKDGS